MRTSTLQNLNKILNIEEKPNLRIEKIGEVAAVLLFAK
jgi:hypothetical protein